MPGVRRCGSCGDEIKTVLIGHRELAVEPEPHSAGNIACPTDRHSNLAHVLEHGEAPARGFTRHRRHTHRREEG